MDKDTSKEINPTKLLIEISLEDLFNSFVVVKNEAGEALTYEMFVEVIKQVVDN